MLAAVQNILRDLLFPPACYCCEELLDSARIAEVQYVCRNCLRSLPFREVQELSAEPLKSMLEQLQDDFSIHLAEVPQIFSIWFNEGEIRRMILALKFGGGRKYARFLGHLMARAAGEKMRLRLRQTAGIVPIPLGKKRLRERGYNQAALLARFIAADMGLEYFPHLLRRAKETMPQAKQKDVGSRRANIRGAFEIRDETLAKALAGRKIILLDDILTTGSTMVEAMKPLLAAGIAVTGLVAASGKKQDTAGGNYAT